MADSERWECGVGVGLVAGSTEGCAMERGTEVTVRAFKGEMLRRRVWEDVGRGVMLTSEGEYQRAIREGDEARAAGFAKSDIVEVHTPHTKEAVVARGGDARDGASDGGA